MNAFLVTMQYGRNGDWLDAGTPELVEGDPTCTNARDFAIDYALDNQPEGGDWRVLVWAHAEDGYDAANPDACIQQSDLPQERQTARWRKPATVKHRPRTRGPVFDVVTKRVASDDLIKRHILVTANPQHSIDGRSWPGTAWYAAAGGATSGVSVMVRGYGEMTWRGEHVGSLHTTVGEIRFPVGTAVVVAEEG